MAPTPTGTAFCMARPRVRSRRALSLTLRLPAAASAGSRRGGAESPGLAQAPNRSLEAARLLVAANLFPGPGAACAAYDVARPVLVVRPGGGKPQHGGVVRLHLHAIRIPAFTEYAVDARKIVTGHVEQQMMLEVVVDVIGCDEQPLEKIRARGAGVAQGIVRVWNDCMFSNVADPGNDHLPGEQRQQP